MITNIELNEIQIRSCIAASAGCRAEDVQIRIELPGKAVSAAVATNLSGAQKVQRVLDKHGPTAAEEPPG